MTKKLCTNCNKEKEISEFYSRGKSNISQHMCKSCYSIYFTNRWRERKKWAVEYMGGKCCLCGLVDHYSVYDFHHIDPSTKGFVWTKLRLRSLDSIKKELLKCKLICSNCHRKLHYS